MTVGQLDAGRKHHHCADVNLTSTIGAQMPIARGQVYVLLTKATALQLVVFRSTVQRLAFVTRSRVKRGYQPSEEDRTLLDPSNRQIRAITFHFQKHRLPGGKPPSTSLLRHPVSQSKRCWTEKTAGPRWC